MKQYETFEITVKGPQMKEDQVAADITAEFVLGGKSHTVKGFYAGDETYKVRFLPMEAGTCTYQVKGIVELSGEENVEPADYAGKKHGPVKTSGYHFTYADGTRYLPFGTTVYALVHQPKDLVDETMETLKNAPFNKIRFCIFPKHYAFNLNEPELFAFERGEDGWNVRKPCMAFWDMLEQRIKELAEVGIEADLILFHPYDHWGFAELTKEECMIYLDYAMRRLSAFPNVWWSLANEYELMESFELERWGEMASFIGENDPYGHMLSNHDIVQPWDFSHPCATHCCLQSSEAEKIFYLQKEFGKPVILDEMGYEGNIPFDWGNLSGFELVNRFWKTCCSGGYATHGETFMEEMNDEQILWWSKGGSLKGESPARIRFLRDLLESLPGPLTNRMHEKGLNLDSKATLQKLIDSQVKGICDNPIFRLLNRLNDEDFRHMRNIFSRPDANYKDEVYISYLGSMCTAYGEIELPETGSYTVEVIDVWEMTREVAQTDVCGKVAVQLPAKPGMAILATKVSNV